MRLGIRLLFVFFLLNGLAAFFVLRVFSTEIKPSAREVMEDTLVDTANVLAELARDDLAGFAAHMDRYAKRTVNAPIWGFQKESLDYSVYVTDATGIVRYDSKGEAVGRDYSQWRDVARTLRGEYGARSTREVAGDDKSSVMHVAAPIFDAKDGSKIVGVLTVSKPVSTIQDFIDRAERKVLVSGAWWLALSALVGVLVTLWVVWHIRRLRRYAQQVQIGGMEQGGSRAIMPKNPPGELGDLAKAMQAMRAKLDGRDYVRGYVSALTHEIKTPLAVIRANAELLDSGGLEPAQQAACNHDILQQTLRMNHMIGKLLELSRIEQSTPHKQVHKLADVVRPVLQTLQSMAAHQGVHMQFTSDESSLECDADLVALAVSNVLHNALAFSKKGGNVAVAVSNRTITVEDNGVGVADYALPRLGERFFSTVRPNGERSGSGLGLAIGRQIMRLHGGSLVFSHASPSKADGSATTGLRVELQF